MRAIPDRTVDTHHIAETPEGALLRFAVAGPLVRGMAWLIDSLIRLALLIALVALFGSAMYDEGSEGVFVGMILIVQFMLSWLYTTLFEATTSTTPGKYFYKLAVVHDNGTPITPSSALIRNFLRAIDSLPMLNMVGLACMLIDNRFRRLGDLAAGTLVVYRESAEGLTRFEHATSSPPPAELTREHRLAIVDFAERCQSLSPARQKELADSLRYLMDDGADSVDTLKSWAQWILGGQSFAQSSSV